MKLTAILLFIVSMQVSAKGYGQSVTLSEKNASLEKVFKEIKTQSGFTFLYRDEWLRQANTVNIELHHATIEEALEACFKNQPLTYILIKTMVVVSLKPISVAPSVDIPPPNTDIQGQVIDSAGTPLSGASVTVKGSRKGTQTDANGHFGLKGVDGNATLIISFTGYGQREITLGGKSTIIIRLSTSNSQLDKIQVIAYGNTTQRLYTGDVTTVKGEDIAKQPISNPLEALQGRVPGMLITPTSGFSGTNMSVQVRGNNSISNGTDPLYVVDGVPFTSTSLNQYGVYGAMNPSSGYESPLNSINPADIASIDILKDADATAIYGSRGANGVVLITTKKGKAGKSSVDLNFYSGAGKVTRQLPMLNTPQYLALRNEAFQNDGITPNAGNAPDLLTWDQHANTNWEKKIIGGTAAITQADMGISGGSASMQYAVGGSYRKEGSVYGNDFGLHRSSMHFNINHNSDNGRFTATISGGYTFTNNVVPNTDPTTEIVLPPDFPLYNTDGSLNWSGGQTNPMSILWQPITNKTENVLGNALLQYTILPGLVIKSGLGYNSMNMNQLNPQPANSQNPNYGTPASLTQFGTAGLRTTLVEPQIDYTLRIAGKGRLQALAGGSWQHTSSFGTYLTGSQYVSDALLTSQAAAGKLTVWSDTKTEYKYNAFFGRLNYDWAGKYLADMNFRRDGSSRFGPGKRFGNFGALGLGWIFSQEKGIREALPFLSFGKLRGSYGITGNDQIGDYSYLSTWSPARFSYGGVVGITPNNIGNNDYSWERVKKLEGAMELGFVHDRVLFTASWYRNVSDNQLIGYALPGQTGFSSVIANLPARVRNTGWELSLNSTNIQSGHFKWTSTLVLTVPSNKLVSFPNLAASTYASTYIIGQPLSVIQAYQFTGVDPKTGLPMITDQNHDGSIDYLHDRIVAAKGIPDYYGGLSNGFTYKEWTFDFFLQFTKQKSNNILYGAYYQPPGSLSNYDTKTLDRWRNPGDKAFYPKATTTYGSDMYNEYYNFSGSTAGVSDASFIRLKTLSLHYRLPKTLIDRMHLQGMQFYVQGQNLLTFTHYYGLDPRVHSLVLPPLKTLTAGIQVSF